MSQLETRRFLLTPDSSAARRVRRVLAEGGARAGIVAGTWLELVEQAANAYLLPVARDGWEEALHRALHALPNAFWARSLEVAPGETAAEVETALWQIVSASDPNGNLADLDTSRLAPRARRHVDDIVRLLERLGGVLPDGLAVMRDLITADPADSVRHIVVQRVEDTPALSRWQAALVDKFNRDAAEPEDPELSDVLAQNLGAAPARAATAAPTSLATLQANLFASPDQQRPLDDSVQWIGVRDYLAEVETAAGMVQTLLGEDADLAPAEIGVLLPDDFIYAVAVDDVFSRAGLAVSGLPLEHWQRDLGREAVFHFLYCRDKPAPAMALAVCLSSPLMPWSREDGAVLAQAVMDGDYRLRPPRDAGRAAHAMLNLIRDGDQAPATLGQGLRNFASLLDGGDGYAGHVAQARATAEALCLTLARMAEIDWLSLRRAASPQSLTVGAGPDFTLEGATIWRESQEAWRPVRHLIVCGFGAGYYPVATADSPVFSGDDLQAIRTRLDLPVDTPADALARRRSRFRRQLAQAADSVTFLVPRRDPAGAAQAPSESLVFMHQLFDTPGAESAEALVLELDAADDRERIRFLARAPGAEPRPARALTATDLDFERDLLALRRDAAGALKPESPSSLETLMVSRLAWLLRRLRAEPLGWAPETLDPMLMGTLAHQVFEVLFPVGGPLPEALDMTARVERLLDDAIARSAPFLRAAQWQVERRHLAGELARAAGAWRNMLTSLDAELLANEIWLAGTLQGIPIHGQADALLGLPGDRLLVVDYKRSRSNSRRPRMEKGYDSQASLYRTMLETGGPKHAADAGLGERLRQARHTGIVYYMLNDQRALSDSRLEEVGTIPGWEPVEGDVASHALALIDQRLRELRQGRLALNRESETQSFEKDTGIKPYALDNSPLIALFTIAEEEGAE